jgi:hypothetical protein
VTRLDHLTAGRTLGYHCGLGALALPV